MNETAHQSQEIVVVTGLGIGEEAKGNAVEFFARALHAHTVYRTGGWQGAHNATLEDGREHEFRHFSAATFEGSDTHLIHMVISPTDLFAEARELERMGIKDPLIGMTIDDQCLTTTPFHAAMSRLREILREEKKGTIGKGVGEAIRDSHGDDPDLVIRAAEYFDSKKHLVQKIDHIRKTKLTEARELIRVYSGKVPHDAFAELDILMNARLVETTADSLKYLSELVRIVDQRYLDLLLEKEGVTITETSHGALLDPKRGFVPHTTQIDPTAQDFLGTLRERNYQGKIIRIGVSRSYMTRHGAGPLVSHSPAMTREISETHNSTGQEWLGEFRNGYYDTVALRYGIEVAGGIRSFDGLMISYFDALIGRHDWPICTAYTYSGEARTDLSNFFEMDGERITGIKFYPETDGKRLEAHQRQLTALLNDCQPVVTILRSTENQTLEEVFTEFVQDKLGLPVVAIARGPKASDREILPGYMELFDPKVPSHPRPEFYKPGIPYLDSAEQVFEKIQTSFIGLEGPIHKVLVQLRRGNRVRPVGEMYVKGIIMPDKTKQTDGHSIYRKWRWLKDHNQPVLTTIRVNEEGDAVLMSDATEGGKYVIIDKHTDPTVRANTKINNLEEVKSQVRMVARECYAGGNGIFLDKESYAVQVDEHGQAHVMLIDLGALAYQLSEGRAISEGSLFRLSEAQHEAEQFIEEYLTSFN